MNWRQKAWIQTWISRLPSAWGYHAYYQMQRRFGGLRVTDPTSRMGGGVSIWRHLREQGQERADRFCLEIGTGWRLNTPIALWLLGAKQIITVDLHRYLKPELVFEDVQFLREHPEKIAEIYPTEGLRGDRLERLLKCPLTRTNCDALLELCQIQYLAPQDASALPLAGHSVDLEFSFNVFEHIPGPVLSHILTEGRRVLKPTGLSIHCVDYTDHFSHSDGSISSVNFLQYEDRDWDRLAGNRYMYMNRLRVDDFEQLFQGAGYQILTHVRDVDEAALRLLKNGEIPLATPYQDRSLEVLATAESWFVATPETECQQKAQSFAA